MDDPLDYLFAFGLTGELGRFPSAGLTLRRGDRAVLKTTRGIEIGEVLRATSSRRAALLGESAGELVRPVTSEDETLFQRLMKRADDLFQRGNQLADEMNLPVAVLDAEILLDGAHGVLHHVRSPKCDIRDLVAPLAREFDLHLSLVDLSNQVDEEEGGCGSCGSGGCGSGGCGTGGCGSGCGGGTEDVQAYFADLRQKMERRVSLL